MRFDISLTLLLLALTLSIRAQATLMHRFDFEKGSPEPYTLDGAVTTAAPGSVLSGDRSLLADFRKSDIEWNEFLTTDESVRFRPGGAYYVSFRYRVVDPGSKKTQFYSLLRSRSGAGKDKYGDFWLWNRERGAEGTIHRLFRVDEADDWTLILGVRHQGSVIVDDIEIHRCETAIPGLGLPVKAGKTDLPARKAALDEQRRADGLDLLMRDMLVVWCNEGAGAKIVDARAEYAREHNPDFVDWNPCGPLAKEFGVRTATGGPEYQEFYKFEGPEVWNSRYDRFIDNGFAVSLDGTVIKDETWGEGGYFTCHNGRGWHNWFTRELLKQNRDRLGMCQDNIGCAPFYKGRGCFCEPCLVGFRQWLRSRYSASELSRFGIGEIDAFDYRIRVMTYGLTGNQALRDPITREYIKFQFCSQLEAWADVVESVKKDSKERGFPVPCYGNQIGAFGMWPFAVAIGAFCDVVEIEEVISVGDTIPNWSLTYKMGRASGHEEKAVWVRGPVHDSSKDRAPQLSPLFWAVHFSQALACGGVRDISFGINAPWTGDPATLDYIDSPELREVWKQYAQLCDANRAVFSHRESLASVALVYSLPTTLFRRYCPLDIDDDAFFGRFDKTARWLDENHVPYDCIVFGHPEMFPTAIAGLKRYEVILLASADALSDVQCAALRDFAARGGKVIKIGDIGTYDENLNDRRAESRLAGIKMIDLAEEKSQAREILRAASPVNLDAPESVTANLWHSAGGASVDLHLVNYGADLAKGVWHQTGPVTARVTLPAEFQFDTVRLLRFGKPAIDLQNCTVKGGVAMVEAPALESYSVISFARKADLDKANEEAKLRRAEDRAAVRRLAQEKGLY